LPVLLCLLLVAATPAAAKAQETARLREARIYEVSPLRCPGCGSEMRILAFITDPDPVAIADESVRVQSILVLRAIDN
jgi:hypothetical protein